MFYFHEFGTFTYHRLVEPSENGLKLSIHIVISGRNSSQHSYSIYTIHIFMKFRKSSTIELNQKEYTRTKSIYKCNGNQKHITHILNTREQ